MKLLHIPGSAMYVLTEIGIDHSKPNIGEYGILYANLVMVRNNGLFDEASWMAFLDHLAFPDHNPVPQGVFLLPIQEVPGYKALIDTYESLYQKHGE